jgi:hypothetical protein
MPLGETEAKVSSRLERERERGSEGRVSDILAGKPPQALMVRRTEKKLLLQRLREVDRPILASDGNWPPP